MADVKRCTRCKRVKCPAENVKSKNQTHTFEGQVCKHCHHEQCPQFCQEKIDAEMGTHHFKDGRCIYCGHYECVRGEIHGTHKRDRGYCADCFKEMCDDQEVHHMDESEVYCTKCHKYFGRTDQELLCEDGCVHQNNHGKCSVCGVVVCQKKEFMSCKPVFRRDNEVSSTCESCNVILCPGSDRPHAFVDREMPGSGVTVKQCTTCNQYMCGDGVDVHKFDDDGFCDKCKKSRCSATGNTHRTKEIIIQGKTMMQCLDCRQVLCHASSYRNHKFEDGKCANCRGYECSNGNIHIFAGPEMKCLFCSCVQCDKSGAPHHPRMDGDKCICESCGCRICPEAMLRKQNPLITICQDDGRGLCRFCLRGLCTDPKTQTTIDHVFDKDGVCKTCRGSKCEKVDCGCHYNENGACVFCGIQLCCGNRGHIFDDDGICKICYRESCPELTDQKGAHSPWKDGCCEFCKKELCSDGKRLHQFCDVPVKAMEGKKLTCFNISVCRLCHCEQCPNPKHPDQCHSLGLGGSLRCVKCQHILCKRREDNDTHLARHYFDDKGICCLCHQCRCNDRGDVHHTQAGSTQCYNCHQSLCKNRRPHSKDGDGFCEFCRQQICRENECHCFDSSGKCTHCGGYRCQDHSSVHEFSEDDYHDRQYCKRCSIERCECSGDKNDVCRYISAIDPKEPCTFCIKCLKVRCPLSHSTENSERLLFFPH